MSAVRRAILVWFLLFISPILWAAEQDLYNFLWLDSDKKVYVLQNKVYKKKGTHYVNLGYIADFSSNYENLRGIQGAWGYFFGEDWGVELAYHYYKGNPNSDAKNLELLDGVVPFIRKVDSKASGVILWSPFYGKINTFNKIIYFDWSFGLGGGMIWGRDNAETIASPKGTDRYVKTVEPALTLKNIVRIYITRRLSAILEYHYDVYNARKAYTKAGRENGTRMVYREEIAFLLGMSF